MPQAYPLSWPDGWKRTAPGNRRFGQFNKKERVYGYSVPGQAPPSYLKTKELSVSDAISRVLAELQRMGASREDVIISTNVRTRLDGLPRSNESNPADPGVAVYWQIGNAAMKCMAVDQYVSVADNLAAVAATLDAMRAIERHGGADILERAFRGFNALPERGSQPWRDVMGFAADEPVNIDTLQSRFRELAHQHHPDKGGDPERWHALMLAKENAMQDLRS